MFVIINVYSMYFKTKCLYLLDTVPAVHQTNTD